MLLCLSLTRALVAGGKKPGLEILYPVSTVILGGLVTSTFCEFLIHPGLFWRFSGKDAGRLARGVGSDEDLLRAADGKDAKPVPQLRKD